MDHFDHITDALAASDADASPAPRQLVTHPRITGWSGAGGAFRISVRRAQKSTGANPQMSSQVFDSNGFFSSGFFTKPDAE
jgi:hypothetical protein